MAQTLTWQGAYVVAELGITAPRTDVPTLAAISSMTELLLGAATGPSTEIVEVARRVVTSLGVDSTHVTPAL